MLVTFAGPALAGPANEDGTPVTVQADDPYGLADPATLAFWTPKRMAAATPLDARPPQSPPPSGKMGIASSRPTAATWTGSPVVGALFLSNGSGSHYCTASVVSTTKKSLIVTAGHCLYGTGGWAKNIVFVPRYSQSKGSRPYGAWTIKYMYVPSRWKTHRDPGLEFGFAVAGTQNGKRVADVVGANRRVINQGYPNRVRVIGSPMKKYSSVDKPIYC